jgi:hypothetical protein
VVDFISNNMAAIALVLAGLCLLTIVTLQSLQVSRLRRRIDDLTGGVEGGDLEAILGEHLETVHQVGRDLDELTARTAILESSARHHFSRQGLMRFNPFPDTGGNQSFALALLDESDDGFVMSSLHSRTGTRIYAKVVTGGKADGSLSTEEQEAIDEARTKRAARPAPPRSAAASRPATTTTVASAPAAVEAPKAAPAAPAPKTTPVAMAAPKAVPAGKPAAAPVAKAAAPAPAHETRQSRTVTEQAKGQEKSKKVPAPDVEAPSDSERVGVKPGRPPVSESRPK